MIPTEAAAQLVEAVEKEMGRSQTTIVALSKSTVHAMVTTIGALLQREQDDPSVMTAARDLVALWRQQKIAGVTRAQRNGAIDAARERLERAVDAAKGW